MTINSVDSYAGLYQNYKIPSVQETPPKAVEPEELKKAPAVDRNQESQPTQEINSLRRNTKTDLQNIALTFNKEDDFDYLGKDSAIGNLDVQKAVSDMKKDQILEEYQYFVGSASNFMQQMNTQDGTVIPKY